MPGPLDAHPHRYPQRFRRLLSRPAPASQPSCLRLYGPSNPSCRFGSSCVALRHRAKVATMAVADFSLHRADKVQAQGPASPFQAQGEISQGKARDLRSIYPPHLRPLGPECLRASGIFAPSPTSQTPRMRFVFLGPELCLQLPSRVSSRSYGCCSARGSRHSGPPGDSHPQVTSPSAFASGLSAPVTALRAMPGAQRKRRGADPAASFLQGGEGRLLYRPRRMMASWISI